MSAQENTQSRTWGAQESEFPLVSCIIPAYNSARYIEKAVDSCLNQTYPQVEVIIVDDGSQDDTRTLIESRYGQDPRVRYFYQQNDGASSARNHGMAQARGAFIHFVDADEWLLPSKIAKSYALFEQYPETGVVYGHGIPISPDGQELPMDYPPLPSGEVFCQWVNGTMSGGTYGVTSSFMVRKSALDDVGGFDMTLPITHDWDLWLRLARRYSFQALDEKLVYYLRIETGLHANRVKMALDRLRVYERIGDYPERARCLSDDAYQQLLASRWQLLAMRYWEAGQRPPAREALRKAIAKHASHQALRRMYLLLTYVAPYQVVNLIDKLLDLRKRGF